MSEQSVVIQPMRSGHPIEVSRGKSLVDITIGDDGNQRGVIFDCSDPETVRMAYDLINALSRLVAEAKSAKAGRSVSAG